MKRLKDIEEKNNVVNINLDSFIMYLRDQDFEIECWRSKHLKELKKRVACEEIIKKVTNYIKSFEYYIPEDSKIELLHLLGDDEDETNS